MTVHESSETRSGETGSGEGAARIAPVHRDGGERSEARAFVVSEATLPTGNAAVSAMGRGDGEGPDRSVPEGKGYAGHTPAGADNDQEQDDASAPAFVARS